MNVMCDCGKSLYRAHFVLPSNTTLDEADKRKKETSVSINLCQEHFDALKTWFATANPGDNE